MIGVDPTALVIVTCAVLVGATLQSVVGLGLGLVAAPVTTLVAPELMPGLVIALALVLPCLTLVAEHGEIHWRGLLWSLPPRLAGTAAGVWVVAHFSDRALGVAIGLMVLIAVLLTWSTIRIPLTRGTLVAAGLVSGVTGTATSIGGPPFALLYQHRGAVQIRTTLAVYFLLGALMSLVGLGLSGDLTGQQLRLVAALAPAVLLGSLVGIPLRRRVPASTVRPGLLVVCGASATMLLVRSLMG